MMNLFTFKVHSLRLSASILRFLFFLCGVVSLLAVLSSVTYMNHSNDASIQHFLPLPKVADEKATSTLAQQVVVGVGTSRNISDLTLGVLSHEKIEFFRELQQQIDGRDPAQRCKEYGFQYNPNKRINRRIFYGALIADETWELLDITSTESYGIFSGIVFVESNRTQNLTPRPFRHTHDTQPLKTMFHAPVLMMQYVQESQEHLELEYEHSQRQQILLGWKQLGMLPNDVGMIADSDEMFTRDFLRAVQSCDQIKMLMYNNTDVTDDGTVDGDGDASSFSGHFCQHQYVKLIGTTQVFESSPECVTDERSWFHPDMILGHCIEGIGDHVPAPRQQNLPLFRASGYGADCDDYEYEKNVTNPKDFISWNAGDFRRGCGGDVVSRIYEKGVRSKYTAFHFHNFFVSFNQTRFKHQTYGHPDKDAQTKSVDQMHEDIALMYRCVKNIPDSSSDHYNRVVGGFDATLDFRPIYFHDDEYRRRRHAHVQQMIEIDEQMMKSMRAEQSL